MLKFPKPGLSEFYRTYNIAGFAVNREETRIAMATNISGKYNVWGLDLPNAYPYPLTYQDQVPSMIQFDPQGRYILVGFDEDGDENTQIYAISPQGGALVDVRRAPGKRHYFGELSEDGERLYYTSDKDNAMFQTIYRYHLESGAEEVLVQGTVAPIFFVTVSPDESSLVYIAAHGNTHVVPYLQKQGEQICLTPDPTVPQATSGAYFLNQDTILFTTNFGKEYSYLAKYTVSTGAFAEVFSAENKEISELVCHRESTKVYLAASSGVEDDLYEGDASGHFALVSYPGALVGGLKMGRSGRLYAMITQENRPGNLFVRDETGDWTALTNNKVLGVAQSQMPRAQTVHYPSFDGLQIEAIFYQAQADVANGHTIIMPHGGPQSADRKYFWSFTQFLLSQGYDIFAPNFRGSSGYGAAFTKLVERDWGGGPRLDMVAGIEWLLAQGLAKRDRLFVVGGSYGGYMTLLLHGRHADYFRAAVDIFGPSNMFTFIQSVPESWKPMMDSMVGDPERDREKLTEDSPITYLEGMSKPMLVIQGAHDPRVVKAESDQIVDALRAKGREVEYIVLEDEGHGFTKKENELRVYQAVADFLARHQA